MWNKFVFQKYKIHGLSFACKSILKRSLTILILAGLFSLPLFSQVKFGIKTGVTAQLVPVYDMNYGSIRIEPKQSGGLGFHTAAYLCIGTESMFFQPEVLFESVTFEYIVIYQHVLKNIKQNVKKLYMPLLFGVQFNVMRIYFGPAPSLRIGAPKPLVPEPGFEKLYSKFSLDYQLGIGIDLLKKLDLEVRYRAYLGKHFEGVEKIGYQTITLNKSNSSILLSIGYKF
jgi:hypothetical protein